ncbi:CpsD/CapB family tyrosine-protein kinase [bacterium]|nr:CpsD/CapB family tyrosine-protein kinase [bacterium]MBU1675647.1 CpsD/CapB family tyrosine-protein kinase [bacterium]
MRKKKRKGLDFDIESPLAIELRRVMIRINRELDLERKRCIMVTSSERGEGKSLFSLHFSQVLAHHMQKRILLIDGDMRRPVQHTIFQTGRGPGLAELLRGDDDGIRPCNTLLANLDFLPAGHAGENPSKLLQGARVRSVFDKLKSAYDIVILDSPPVVPVSDPLQFVDVVDGAIYMVLAGRTPRDVCERGVGILRGVGTNIIGVVANNLAEVLPYYYDHKYYGYGQRVRRAKDD